MSGFEWEHEGHKVVFWDFFLHFSQKKHRPKMRRTTIAPVPKEKPCRIDMLKPYWLVSSEPMAE